VVIFGPLLNYFANYHARITKCDNIFWLKKLVLQMPNFNSHPPEDFLKDVFCFIKFEYLICERIRCFPGEIVHEL